MPFTVPEKADWLAKVQLFRGVPRPALERIAERCTEVDFPAGHYIVQQGQIGNGLYLIVTGRAKVVRGDVEIAEFGPGDFVGELAVLDQMPRAASVVAEDDVTCLALASWDLNALIEQEPAVAMNLLRELTARIRSLGQQHHH